MHSDRKLYRHYRTQAVYEVLHVGLYLQLATGPISVVIYRELTNSDPHTDKTPPHIWVRPYDEFFGDTSTPGVKRFTEVEVTIPKDMWTHNCRVNGLVSVAKGEPCSWCNAQEPMYRRV